MKKLLVLMFVFAVISVFAHAESGYVEIGGHYSYWNIDVIGKLVSENAVPDFDYYDPAKGKLNFKSEGNNYGVELRFFPGGKKGSFSIGFSYERNNFKAKLDGSYTETDNLGRQGTATVTGTMDLVPHSFNVNLRWEIAPAAFIHPYFGIGFGFGKLEGAFTAHSSLAVTGQPIQESNETLTLREALDKLKEEGNEFPFKFFPIVQVQLGLRIQILPGVYALAEGAVYDGLTIRGGLSFRL
ncbi:MAG: hypothetical protein ACM3SY_03595 [Candidatus Omnitrophota bacterium]